MIKKFTSLLLCAVVVGAPGAYAFEGGAKSEATRQQPRADAIDHYLKAEMARQGVPGLAVVVMKHGQPVRVRALGVANLEHAVALQPYSLSKPGAVGMALTAATVLSLVEDGKMKLDDSIRQYLPEAPQSWQPVTIRHMLNHTSGLPATPNGDFRTEYTDAEFLDILYKEELNFPAGARWRFGYVNYVALGFAIKRVTGEGWTDVMAQRVFKPLGMKTARPISDLKVIPNRAAGYEFRDGELRNAEFVSQTANSTADGSIFLSPLDYAAWAAGIAKQTILKPHTWADIGRPARIASGATYPYGLGWYLEHSAGQQVWRHTGAWQGFQSAIIRYVGDGLTIVALTNGDNGNPAKITRQVAAMMDAKYKQAPAIPLDDRDPQRTSQVKKLLASIAEGQVAYGDFTQFAELDFNEGMAVFQGMVAPLGAFKKMALIQRTTWGDDQVLTYRALYESGIVDVRVGFAPNGKIGNLDIFLVDDWQAPVSD